MKVPISTVGLTTIITNLTGEKWYFLLCSLIDQVLGEAAAALQLPEGSCAGQARD